MAEVPSYEQARIHGVSSLTAISDAGRVLLWISTEHRRHRLEARAVARRRRGSARNLLVKVPRRVTGIALRMAGQKRAYLREPWESDLLGEDGMPLALSRQLRHVAGYVPAAIRYRADDLGCVLGRLLDSVLASRRRTCAIEGALLVFPVVMIFSRKGLYGLITNADQLAVLFAVLCGSVRGLRKWRGIGQPRSAKEDHRR